ncbi:MAG: signal peptidase I [Arsenicicoccus sp.]|uniref:signal peptidase I n=1 Tax=Serinicoccus profundi TaxID=1078471 RepID=UPI000255E866|nr:signal peptidase I [Serinicoccus profundi]PZU48110.1 MAG: signal peptidase I [Arsenicicoccus sp.]
MTEPTRERGSSSDEHPPEPVEQPARSGGFWAGVKEVAAIAATALVISFLIKTFLAQAFWIPSGSMENTLVYGDRVMVSKIQAGAWSVDRGDVVVFEDPGGWLPPVQRADRGPVINAALRGLEFVGVAPSSQGNHLIKRVIGLPGDTVECCDEQGRLLVNGEPLEEDYLFPGDDPSTTDFAITVPEDHIWLMGDHRSNSRDSRANDDGTGQEGSVPLDDVVGQAVVLIYPFDHFDWFSVPDTFTDVPAAP